jgi:SSS family solute:Na+ symporter
MVKRSFKRANPADAFFVNNRASGALGVAFSLVVSCVGASATIGMAGMAFKVGTPAFWWLGAGAVGLSFLTIFLAARVRESAALTMPEMVGKLFGARSRTLVSIIIVLAWTAILAAQFSALGRILSALTGFAPGVCLTIGFALVTLHTLGGQAVIIKTDGVQAIILLIGLAFLAVWLSRVNPDFMASVKFEIINESFSAVDLGQYLFVIGGNYLVCPTLFGRFLSAKSAGAARRGGFYAVGGLALSAALIVLIGLSCRGLAPADTPADAVLATAIASALPPWLAALIHVTLISAVVSSADSCLITSATVLSHDLLGVTAPSHCRKAVLLLAALGMGLTFLGRDILDYLFMAYDIYVAGVVMPVFIALVMSPKRAANSRFIVTAIAGGGLLGGLAALTGITGLSVAGMAFSSALTLWGMSSGAPASSKLLKKTAREEG